MELRAITPRPRALLLRIIVPFLSIILFAVLAYFVNKNATLPFDEWVLVSLNGRSSLFWDYFFVMTTQLGGVFAVTVVGVGLVLFFAQRRQWKRVLVIICALGGAAALTVVMKLLFERPRPDLWEQIEIETSFSFPSGHAMASMALASLLAYLVLKAHWKRWVKVICIVTLVLYVLAIGVSRLYLGVHYPSDILAGWIISAGWVVMVISLVNRYVRT